MAAKMQQAPQTHRQYSATAKALHWLSVLLLLSLFVGAARFAWHSPADRASVIPIHVTFGLIQLAMLLGLYALRARPGRAELRRPRTGAQKRSAMLTRVFYASFLLQAAIGTAMAALSPVAIRLFNFGPNLSQFLPPSPAALTILRPLHFGNGVLLAALVTLHFAHMLYRHAWLRDGALTPMVPFSGLWQRLKAEEAKQRERMPSSSRRGRRQANKGTVA